MPRLCRFSPAGYLFHVVNRGNDRRRIFHEDAHYEAFLDMVRAGTRHFPVEVHGYCGMPNHIHLVLAPQTDDALSAYMQWVTGSYACHWRAVTNTLGHGHVFQRRFWSVPCEHPVDYWRVLRYVEANALRARLVERAEHWRWGSLAERLSGGRRILCTGASDLPPDWCQLVNLVQTEEVLTKIRKEICRRPGRPSGS